MKRFWLIFIVVNTFSAAASLGQEIEQAATTLFTVVPITITPTEPGIMVSTPRVASDLQLVDSQRQELKDELVRIKDKYQPRIEAARKRVTPDASADEHTEVNKELEKIAAEKDAEIRESIDRILFPFQRQRLVQIAAQARLNQSGAGALNSDEFAKELKLTDEQKKELAKAQEAMGKKLNDEYRRLRIKLQREAVESVLTKSQREKLAEMLGDDLGEEKPNDKSGDNPASVRK